MSWSVTYRLGSWPLLSGEDDVGGLGALGSVGVLLLLALALAALLGGFGLLDGDLLLLLGLLDLLHRRRLRVEPRRGLAVPLRPLAHSVVDCDSKSMALLLAGWCGSKSVVARPAVLFIRPVGCAPRTTVTFARSHSAPLCFPPRLPGAGSNPDTGNAENKEMGNQENQKIGTINDLVRP